MKKARTILLDGTSSSGKTTLAMKLQELLKDAVVFRLSLDDFLHCLPVEFLNRICLGHDMDAFHATVAKFHKTIAFAATLNDMVVVDHVLQFPQWRDSLFDVVGRDRLLYVQVYCPLAILEAREQERGNRRKGLARDQFEPVYSFQDYDVRIDTSEFSPAEAAHEILKNVVQQLASVDGIPPLSLA